MEPGQGHPYPRPAHELFPPLSPTEFDTWVDMQLPRVHHFVDLVVPELDLASFSPDSLQVLGAALVERYPDGGDPLAGVLDADFLDGAMRYVADCLVRRARCEWRLLVHGGESTGFPIIVAADGGLVPVDPLQLVRATCTRGEPDLLRRVLEEWMAHEAASPASQGEAVDGIPLATGLAPAVEARSRAWAARVPGLLDWLGAQTTFELDGSDGSLRELGRLLAEEIHGRPDLASGGHQQLVDAATAYIGSVMITRAGGGWCHALGEPDFLDDHALAGVPMVLRSRENGDLWGGDPVDAVVFAVTGELEVPDPIGFVVGTYCP